MRAIDSILGKRGSEAISPTAHYTGYVWVRRGLSPPAFATPAGRLFYHALRPANSAARAIGGPTLEGFLLARHRAIDHLLTEAIEAGRVSQVIEVAAGLSPRGWRFTRRYGERLTYIETDLPAMAENKRRLLRRVDATGPGHRVAAMDALAEDGPDSLAVLADTLDADAGLAIITEGLLNYFGGETVTGMWRRFAAALGGFSGGLYLADLHLAGEHRSVLAQGFERLLSAFVRGRVHLHFRDTAQAAAALVEAGFADAVLHRPEDLLGPLHDPGARLVRVVEASTAP